MKLADYTLSTLVQVEINVASNLDIDVTCFGLNQDKKLVDDRYVFFYNQLQSPANEIQLQSHRSGAGIFQIGQTYIHTYNPHLQFRLL